MLGDLIANLDRPGVAAAVLTTLDPPIIALIEQRAEAATMAVADLTAGAVREFVDRADDELWLQLLTIMRKADDPGLAAIQAILRWVAADAQPARWRRSAGTVAPRSLPLSIGSGFCTSCKGDETA